MKRHAYRAPHEMERAASSMAQSHMHYMVTSHRLKAVFAAALIIGAAIGAGLAVLVLAVFP
jgi:hypothetical protein